MPLLLDNYVKTASRRARQEQSRRTIVLIVSVSGAAAAAILIGYLLLRNKEYIAASTTGPLSATDYKASDPRMHASSPMLTQQPGTSRVEDVFPNFRPPTPPSGGSSVASPSLLPGGMVQLPTQQSPAGRAPSPMPPAAKEIPPKQKIDPKTALAAPTSLTTATVLYHPTLIFGRIDARKRLFVIWDAGIASSRFIASSIFPLISRVRDSKSKKAIVFIQDLTVKGHIRGPDLLLLCARNPSEYMDYFLHYETDRSDKESLFNEQDNPGFAVNKSIAKVLQAHDKTAAACLKDKIVYERAAFAIGLVAKLKAGSGITAVPAIIYNNQAVAASDGRRVRQVLSAWR